jgi:peptidoglycan/xylan/chitin deacetylase (PgdA/CDA1 family)
LRRLLPDRLVLCYHAIDPDWPSELAIESFTLGRQIEHLLARGFRPATFTETVTGDQPGRRLAITFDDGYLSTFTHAAPVLRELGAVGTVFVPTAFMGRDEPMSWAGVDHWAVGPHRRALLPLQWDHLGQLAEEGWEIGSHGRTHPMLTLADDDLLRMELEGSRHDIEQRLGRPCSSIAYPYGDVDPRVAAAAAAAGFTAGAGLHATDPHPVALNWPRVSLYPVDRRWRYWLKVSSTVRMVRRRIASSTGAIPRLTTTGAG